VSVTTTVTAKIGEKVMFLIEAKQAGIFQIRNVSTEELEPILAVMCPTSCSHSCAKWFPMRQFVPVFACAAESVNFDVLYQQQKQSQVQTTASTTH